MVNSLDDVKKYDRVPVIEAILDLRFQKLEEFDFIKLFSFASSSLIDRYPNISKHVHSEFRPGISSPVDTHEILRLSSLDGKKILQLKPDSFVFSQLAPYVSWEKFIQEVKTDLNVFLEKSLLKNVIRIALRFINRFDFPGDSVELSDYLKIYPEAPASFDMKSFAMQSVFAQDDIRSVLIVRQALVPPAKLNTVSVLLDFDLFNEEIHPCTSVFWDFLERLHKRKNQVFENAITEKTRKLIS